MMKIRKPKLFVLLGAGASSAIAPSTRELTDFLRHWDGYKKEYLLDQLGEAYFDRLHSKIGHFNPNFEHLL